MRVCPRRPHSRVWQQDKIRDNIVGVHDATRLATLHNSAISYLIFLGGRNHRVKRGISARHRKMTDKASRRADTQDDLRSMIDYLPLSMRLLGGAPQRAGKRPASSSGTGSAKKKHKTAAAAAPIPLRVDEEDSDGSMTCGSALRTRASRWASSTQATWPP